MFSAPDSSNFAIHIPPIQKSNRALIGLYDKLLTSREYVATKPVQDAISAQITSIGSAGQIKMPSQLPNDESVVASIFQNSAVEILFDFSLRERRYQVLFYVDRRDVGEQAPAEIRQKYKMYLDAMMVWIDVVTSPSASNACIDSATIYIYLTALEKTVPSVSVDQPNIIGETNVNSAFTFSCPRDGEMVVYRKEEWFKCFIHETFHLFGLDFSDHVTQSVTESCSSMLSLFHVQSDVRLYEAYSEFWARVINAMFCGAFVNNSTENTMAVLHQEPAVHKIFLTRFHNYMRVEVKHSLFQMAKVLDVFDLDYEDIVSNAFERKSRSFTRYKESSNVLAYYIISTVLLNNYGQFIAWCDDHRAGPGQPIFQFDNEPPLESVDELCEFVKRKYKARSFVDNATLGQEYFNKLKLRLRKKHEPALARAIRNLKMSAIACFE